MRERFQAGFDDNKESLEKFGKTYSNQLKAYLIESNHKKPRTVSCPYGKWKKFDSVGWYGNIEGDYQNALFLDATRERVWIVYSVMDAKLSDYTIDSWIKETKGLDRCWLSRNQLLHWQGRESWFQKGIGLKFRDSLSPEEDASNFSLKAWYGANKYLSGLEKIIIHAKENFAIHSLRWQKRKNGSVLLSGEWYSNGKATINRALDVDEVFLSISEIANRYTDSLIEATELRDSTLGAFEIDFSQTIDLEAFSQTVSQGKSDLRLWLVEIEAKTDFRRFRGVDLHNWDRILLDIGTDYAYLTVPTGGCVNAAPRIATIQGENIAGKTSIFHDGVEVFA